MTLAKSLCAIRMKGLIFPIEEKKTSTIPFRIVTFTLFIIGSKLLVTASEIIYLFIFICTFVVF